MSVFNKSNIQVLKLRTIFRKFEDTKDVFIGRMQWSKGKGNKDGQNNTQKNID
jgi:hypothetical protein